MAHAVRVERRVVRRVVRPLRQTAPVGASRNRASLLGMSSRVRLPAVLGLVLLVVVAAVLGARRLESATDEPSPLPARAVRLPLDGSCYVVAIPGRSLEDPPPPPPARGEPSTALAAWLVGVQANPVGSSRTEVTLTARDVAVTVTSVEVSGSQNPPMLQRDWALDTTCRPGTTAPVARSGADPTVVLGGDLDEVAGGRSVPLVPDAGGGLPVRVAPGAGARLVLDLRARTASTRWTATVHWSAAGRTGTTVVDTDPDNLNVLSGARVSHHYGWDVAAGRWVALPSTKGE